MHEVLTTGMSKHVHRDLMGREEERPRPRGGGEAWPCDSNTAPGSLYREPNADMPCKGHMPMKGSCVRCTWVWTQLKLPSTLLLRTMTMSTSPGCTRLRLSTSPPLSSVAGFSDSASHSSCTRAPLAANMLQSCWKRQWWSASTDAKFEVATHSTRRPLRLGSCTPAYTAEQAPPESMSVSGQLLKAMWW